MGNETQKPIDGNTVLAVAKLVELRDGVIGTAIKEIPLEASLKDVLAAQKNQEGSRGKIKEYLADKKINEQAWGDFLNKLNKYLYTDHGAQSVKINEFNSTRISVECIEGLCKLIAMPTNDLLAKNNAPGDAKEELLKKELAEAYKTIEELRENPQQAPKPNSFLKEIFEMYERNARMTYEAEDNEKYCGTYLQYFCSPNGEELIMKPFKIYRNTAAGTIENFEQQNDTGTFAYAGFVTVIGRELMCIQQHSYNLGLQKIKNEIAEPVMMYTYTLPFSERINTLRGIGIFQDYDGLPCAFRYVLRKTTMDDGLFFEEKFRTHFPSKEDFDITHQNELAKWFCKKKEGHEGAFEEMALEKFNKDSDHIYRYLTESYSLMRCAKLTGKLPTGDAEDLERVMIEEKPPQRF